MAQKLRCVKCGAWLSKKSARCSGCGGSNTGVTHKAPTYMSAFYSKVCCVTDKFYPKGGLTKVYVKNRNKVMEYWVDPNLEIEPPDDVVPVYTFKKFKQAVEKLRDDLEQKQSDTNGGEVS